MSRTVLFLFAALLLCGLGSTKPAPEEDESSPEATISTNVDDLLYFYYPNADPEQRVEITYNSEKSLDDSNIKANTKTIMIVDGFLSDSTAPMSIGLPKTLAVDSGVNVILLDWGKLSGAGMTLGNSLVLAGAYLKVLGNVAPIGNRLAEFFHFLKENKQIEFGDVTIIGGSLGAHIGGATGVAIKKNYGGELGRVVGLDPAGPFFTYQLDKDKRLSKGDAVFVEVYHSNRGTLGDSAHDTGDVNIYINGGNKQPGCEEADSSGFAGLCSHAFAWETFDAAANRDLEACPCSGNAECTCLTCSYECDNPIKLGPEMPPSASGRYHATVPLLN